MYLIDSLLNVGCFPRYLYVFDFKTDDVPPKYPLAISMNHSTKTKCRNHLNPAHLCFARGHTSIMLDRRETFCIYDRLDKHPHGDDLTAEKEKHKSKLESEGITCTTVQLCQNYFQNEYLTVLRQGCQQLSLIPTFSQSVAYPLAKLLLNGGDSFKRRDCRVEGNNYGVSLGYARYQKSDWEGSRHYNNILLPPLNQQGEMLLNNMNLALKEKLGDLLKQCQGILQQRYPDAYRNELRNSFWRRYWSAAHWPDLDLFWEFIDINLRSPSVVLGCHLDYMNDTCEGYSHCLVYSQVVCIDGNSMRLSVVMTSRKLCGGAFEKIQSSSAH